MSIIAYLQGRKGGQHPPSLAGAPSSANFHRSLDERNRLLREAGVKITPSEHNKDLIWAREQVKLEDFPFDMQKLYWLEMALHGKLRQPFREIFCHEYWEIWKRKRLIRDNEDMILKLAEVEGLKSWQKIIHRIFYGGNGN